MKREVVVDERVSGVLEAVAGFPQEELMRWSKPMFDALPFLAEAMTVREVAAAVGVGSPTVDQWMRRPWYRYLVMVYRQERLAQLQPALGAAMVNAAEYMVSVTAGKVDLLNEQNFRRANLAHSTLAASAWRLLRNAANEAEHDSGEEAGRGEPRIVSDEA